MMIMCDSIKRITKVLLLLLCMMVLPCDVMAVGTIPSRELGFARSYAYDYLVEYGANPDRINLKMEEYTDRLVFFNDRGNHLFLLMVRDAYANLVNEQVLAFSIGTPHSKARENATFMAMLSYYDNLIKEMHDGVLPKELSDGIDNVWIKPMLHNIRWGQFGLRGLYEGQPSSVLSGCGSVAVAQLMKYYEWPDTVRGDYSYFNKNKELRGIKMDGTPVEWGKLKNIYLYHDKDSDSLAPLMSMVSMAMTVEYGERTTFSLAKYIKRAMTAHFGYSPEMYLAISHDIVERKMMRLIQNNLRAGRPCLLFGGDHVFVCDGTFKGFLHLNMGWNGSYDGWYRFPIVSDRINDKAFIVSALLDITPVKGKPCVEKTLSMEQAGTLSELLTDTEKATVEKLTIIGRINGRDIRLLRRMAGYVDVTAIDSWKGQLTELDISKALIVKDTVSYFEVCNKKSDSINVVRFSTHDATIGSGMFYGCENLKRICLPQNTRNIQHRAFAGCYSLEEITIPAIVRNVASLAFYDCRSLRQVNVCSDSPLLKSATFNADDVFKWCCPDLRIVPDDRLGTYKESLEQEQNRRIKESGWPNKVDPKLYQTTMPVKYKARYKMVNGKPVLIKRIPIP